MLCSLHGSSKHTQYQRTHFDSFAFVFIIWISPVDGASSCSCCSSAGYRKIYTWMAMVMLAPSLLCHHHLIMECNASAEHTKLCTKNNNKIIKMIKEFWFVRPKANTIRCRIRRFSAPRPPFYGFLLLFVLRLIYWVSANENLDIYYIGLRRNGLYLLNNGSPYRNKSV